MLNDLQCWSATELAGRTHRLQHALTTAEAVAAHVIALTAAMHDLDDGWRDELAHADEPARAPITALVQQHHAAVAALVRTATALLDAVGLLPRAERSEETRRTANEEEERQPTSLDSYRRGHATCPVCATRLGANDTCRGCGEQWWRCGDLALAVGLPPGYVSCLIAIGWLPAVPSSQGAWIRQREAERLLAFFTNDATTAALEGLASLDAARLRARVSRPLALIPLERI